MITKNYYLSDLHLSHKNIINFDNRPYFSVEEMNKSLIDNWNNKVHKNDNVFILGDFCWGKEDEWIEFLNQLKGVKTLVRGNHDLKQMSSTCRKLFADVKDYKEIYDNGRRVIMCHYPILCYKQSYSPKNYMLFGHVHNRTQESVFVEKWIDDIKANCTENFHNKAQIINVGCMMPWMNYTPQTLDEIIENYNKWKELQNNE